MIELFNSWYGNLSKSKKEESIKTVFVFSTGANIVGVGVIKCKTEYELLDVGIKDLLFGLDCCVS